MVHGFSTKAFFKLFLWLFILLPPLMIYNFYILSKPRRVSDLLFWRIAGIVFILLIILNIIMIFVSFYLAKRSYVFADKEKVVYVRRLFQFFGLRESYYIHYHILSVRMTMIDFGHRLYIGGQIEAVYVSEDGTSEYRRKRYNKIYIPGCFVDLGGIMSALDSIRMRGQDIPMTCSNVTD